MGHVAETKEPQCFVETHFRTLQKRNQQNEKVLCANRYKYVEKTCWLFHINAAAVWLIAVRWDKEMSQQIDQLAWVISCFLCYIRCLQDTFFCINSYQVYCLLDKMFFPPKIFLSGWRVHQKTFWSHYFLMLCGFARGTEAWFDGIYHGVTSSKDFSLQNEDRVKMYRNSLS